MRKILIINSTPYKVENIKEVNYSVGKPGTIERYLQGDKNKNWLRWFTEYHIKARTKKENFSRTLVLTETEYKKWIRNQS